jgi:hypothetical protein
LVIDDRSGFTILRRPAMVSIWPGGRETTAVNGGAFYVRTLQHRSKK